MSPWWLRPPADADQPAEPLDPQETASLHDLLASEAVEGEPPTALDEEDAPPFRTPLESEAFGEGEEEDEAPAASDEPGVEAAAEGATSARRRRRRRRRRPGGAAEDTTASATAAATTPAAAVEEEDDEEDEDEELFDEPPVLAPAFYAPLPERPATALAERKIAMFCDFENIAIGVRDSEIKKFDINLVLERLLEKGKIIVKRAYADWERYSDYKRALHEAAIELIDIPQRSYSGKNSADIKMVVDAMDLCYAKEHLDTFVVMSGDSDFSPLVSKLKENNKYVIGVGVKIASSSLLVDNCDEFVYYEDVWRDRQGAAGPQVAQGLSKKHAEAFNLLVDAVVALKRENKDVLWGSLIKQTMQRKKPSFNEGYYGYSTFTELLQDAERNQIVKLRRDRRAGTYVVTGFARRS